MTIQGTTTLTTLTTILETYLSYIMKWISGLRSDKLRLLLVLFSAPILGVEVGFVVPLPVRFGHIFVD